MASNVNADYGNGAIERPPSLNIASQTRLGNRATVKVIEQKK